MSSTYSVSQAQSQLPGLVRKVNEAGGSYAITVHNETSAFLVSRERMESLLETLEILSSHKAATAIRQYEKGVMDFTDLAVLDKD